MEKKTKKKISIAGHTHKSDKAFIEETKRLVDEATAKMTKEMLAFDAPVDLVAGEGIAAIDAIDTMIGSIKKSSEVSTWDEDSTWGGDAEKMAGRGHYVIEGNTYPIKEILKQEGFRWSPKEKGWVSVRKMNITQELMDSLRGHGCTASMLDETDYMEVFEEEERKIEKVKKETETERSHRIFRDLLAEMGENSERT